MNKSRIKFKIKQWINIPYATYMCLRFPFLYPRNRFTDKHYNNWKIQEKIKKIRQKYVLKCVSSIHLSSDNFTKDSVKYTIKDTLTIYFLEFLHCVLSIVHCLPVYTELDAMPIGWRKSFGIQMCKEIKKSLKKSKLLYSYRIMQIKEKWGGLRWYDGSSTDEIIDIIHKYEYISYYTCIQCGKPAHYISSGWISPYCEEHAPNGAQERKDFYGWTKSKYKIKGEDKEYSYEELYGEDKE